MKKIKTRDQIKIAAQLLFAERGIDGVSVREIVTAAGQKNMASLHYYFRTKEELVRELLFDAAKVIEDKRTVLLNQQEAAGGPENAMEILKIFIQCAVIEDDDPRSLSNVRLFRMAFQDDPTVVLETAGEMASSAYFRCLEHLRKFLPHLDKKCRERRLVILQHFVFSMLSARERALSNENQEAFLWRDSNMLNEVVVSAHGVLFAEHVLEPDT